MEVSVIKWTHFALFTSGLPVAKCQGSSCQSWDSANDCISFSDSHQPGVHVQLQIGFPKSIAIVTHSVVRLHHEHCLMSCNYLIIFHLLLQVLGQ